MPIACIVGQMKGTVLCFCTVLPAPQVCKPCIDRITEIAVADHTDLDPSRHTQARAVWSLHWVVF